VTITFYPEVGRTLCFFYLALTATASEQLFKVSGKLTDPDFANPAPRSHFTHKYAHLLVFESDRLSVLHPGLAPQMRSPE